MRQSLRVGAVFAAVFAAGCGGAPPAHPASPAELQQVPEPPPENGIPPPGYGQPTECGQQSKIAFTQSTGCLNDDSVEFCVLKDEALEARVKSLAPTVVPTGDIGRAGCNTSVETLYFYPTVGTDASVCISYHGAMTVSAWQQICQLAALPEIRAIVPTWYE